MPQPTSMLALADMQHLLSLARERIAGGGSGVKVEYNTNSMAQAQYRRLRTLCARLVDQSKELYPFDDIRWGKHSYEDLAMEYADNYLIIRAAAIPKGIISITTLFDQPEDLI